MPLPPDRPREIPPEEAISTAATTEGLPIAPAMGALFESARQPRQSSSVNARVARICGLAVLVAICAGFIAIGLTHLIGLITNICFHGQFTSVGATPTGNDLGLWVILVPVGGALVIGVMARYGSAAIRGHGIPEAMEQVLENESRIPPRITFLKPVSAAISIGTGGPFGAEGPIIATGGALGSLVGQLLHTTADERKTLLAAGAAAGMAATFGSPVSAVLLAVELLLFEYRPRSIVPVALAASAATAVRYAFVGAAPAFGTPDLIQPGGAALAIYVALGALVGLASVLVTRAVYWVEDRFEKLPIHWMWWPAIGAIPVGLIGYFEPRTMGVGYENIEHLVTGTLAGKVALVLCSLKFLSWSIALGSGTSGGTLAPLFTIGGGLGALLGGFAAAMFPNSGIDPRIGALVGMAAMFAGASRALLASVVFAFETTRQPIGLLPLLGGCSIAYFVSCLMMKHSIMTEKIARRGVRVLSEFAVDFLDQVGAKEASSGQVVTIEGERSVEEVRKWMSSRAIGAGHQGYPVVDAQGQLVGVVTRRDLLDGEHGATQKVRELVHKAPVVAFDDNSLRDAADLMLHHDIGRLPVVSRTEPRKVVGFLTRSDLIRAHRERHRLSSAPERTIRPQELLGRK
jgi:H+/Cl- antiporter ClcA/predicted transcriptional regulator